MNDEKIIALLKSGKHSSALDKLYQGYPAIRKFILSHGGKDEDAQDVFQEALVIFCQKATKADFQLTAMVSTYLFSVCKYLWKDKLQIQNRYVHNHDFELEVEVNEIIDMHEEERKMSFLDKVLESIGDKCKEVLQAYYFNKWTMVQIAEKFGYSTEASAKNQKYKCLEKAKQLAKSEHNVLHSN